MRAMRTQPDTPLQAAVRRLIEAGGGTTEVARRVGGTPARVSQWIARGHIPAAVQLAHRWLRMPARLPVEA